MRSIQTMGLGQVVSVSGDADLLDVLSLTTIAENGSKYYITQLNAHQIDGFCLHDDGLVVNLPEGPHVLVV